MVFILSTYYCTNNLEVKILFYIIHCTYAEIFLLSWHLNNFKMYINIKMFKSMLRVCNQHMSHFNAIDSRGLPPNEGSAMDGWGPVMPQRTPRCR